MTMLFDYFRNRLKKINSFITSLLKGELFEQVEVVILESGDQPGSGQNYFAVYLPLSHCELGPLLSHCVLDPPLSRCALDSHLSQLQ